MDVLQFCTWTTSQLEKEFATSSTSGLSEANVKNLQKKSKAPKAEPIIWVSILLRQFTSPFIYLLLSVAGVSFFVESKINALIIIIIVLLNGLLSFYQEYRAVRSLRLIKKHLDKVCTVIRDGKPRLEVLKNLVPGDLVVLNPGTMVPADIRLIKGSISVNEAVLTGESVPVRKESLPLQDTITDIYEASNLAFLGTIVTGGTARGIVVGLGDETVFGKLSTESLRIEQSGFEERLTALSRFLLIMIVSTLIALVLTHILIKGIARIDIVELLLFSIALVVGLTPEALPTVTTFSLSRGAALLAKHKVIIKRLSSIEDLGAITLLCTDKTGTLTENDLSVSGWFAVSDELLLYAHLLALRPETDPFDKALSKMEGDTKLHLSEYTILEDQPFDPEKRLSGIIAEKNGTRLVLIRGALEDVTKRSLSSKNSGSEWLEKQNAEGKRILAVASKQGGALDDTDLSLAGYIAFSDVIKKSASEAVIRAHRFGIGLKMVTGDSKEVGSYVAKSIGLLSHDDEVITGEEFEQLAPTQQQAVAKKCTVFVRFLPAQKERLISLLRKECVVGFLGDGINDVPAINAAHVGIVVQNANDVTKDAADIILLNKSLLIIVDGIAIGRRIFANTIKYITASISSNFGNFYSIAIASLLIDFLPLLPRQILLIAFLSDFPMISIAFDTIDVQELRNPPSFNMRSIAFISTLLGMVSSVFDFIFFSYFVHSGPLVLQTTWFIECILTEVVLIFSVRTRMPFFKAPWPSPTLFILSALVVIITLILPFTSLGDQFFHLTRFTKEDLGIILIIVLGYFVSTEIVKLSYYYFMNNEVKKPC